MDSISYLLFAQVVLFLTLIPKHLYTSISLLLATMHSPEERNFVLVRSKRTSKIDIRRANRFSKYRSTSLSIKPHELHYVGRDCTRVCRCVQPYQHSESLLTVASNDTHLHANLLLYMERNGLESTTIPQFNEHMKQRKSKWCEEGVNIDAFHYASKDKSLVCRCSRQHKHDYGIPRNPHIIEQCVEFFRSCKDRNLCTKEERQTFHSDSPPAYSSYASKPSKPRYLPFQYDSPSTYNLLLNRATQTDCSPISPEMELRNTAESFVPSGMRHLLSGSQGEPDIPEEVWHKARPSIWTCPSQGAGSSVTTPLGTHFTPISSSSQTVENTRDITVTLPKPQHRLSGWPRMACDVGDSEKVILKTNETQQAESLSNMTSFETTVVCSDKLSHKARDSRAQIREDVLNVGPSVLRQDSGSQATMTDVIPGAHLVDSTPSVKCSAASERDFYKPSHSCSELSAGPSVPVRDKDYELEGTPIGELPLHEVVAELGVKPIYRHIETLHNLEGRDWDTASELAEKHYAAYTETAVSSTSTVTKASVRLSSLFEQIHGIIQLLDQKTFMLRYATTFTRTNQAPHCPVCDEPCQDHRRCTIMLPGCSHVLHEKCLLTEFRRQDQRVGKCPVCDLALCKRSLADRVDIDCEAIFGMQFIQLRNEVRIDFLQHSEIVTCRSEEELAAAQLRLLKDYIDVHAEELYHQWEDIRAEPDWYAGVIQPATRLFQGWNTTQESRYFTNGGAFLKLVAWAELVRLMNNTRAAVKKTQGEQAPSPHLDELRHKFMLAKDRYDKEKEMVSKNGSGDFDCDKVVQDAIELALSTHCP